jgi:PhnB protein
MQVNPHLAFNGECEAAFRFYEKCLGGKLSFLMSYGDSPMAAEVPGDWKEKVVHATLEVGSYRITGADVPPGQYSRPDGFSVALNVAAAEEAEQVFRGLSEGGTIQVPLQETFWAVRFGMVVDRYGIPWMVNCGRPQN